MQLNFGTNFWQVFATEPEIYSKNIACKLTYLYLTDRAKSYR